MRNSRYLYSRNRNTLFIVTKSDEEEAKAVSDLSISAAGEEVIPLTPTDPVDLRRSVAVHPDAKPRIYVTFFGDKPAVVHDTADALSFGRRKDGGKYNDDLIEPEAVFTIGQK